MTGISPEVSSFHSTALAHFLFIKMEKAQMTMRWKIYVYIQKLSFPLASFSSEFYTWASNDHIIYMLLLTSYFIFDQNR